MILHRLNRSWCYFFAVPSTCSETSVVALSAWTVYSCTRPIYWHSNYGYGVCLDIIVVMSMCGQPRQALFMRPFLQLGEYSCFILHSYHYLAAFTAASSTFLDAFLAVFWMGVGLKSALFIHCRTISPTNTVLYLLTTCIVRRTSLTL